MATRGSDETFLFEDVYESDNVRAVYMALLVAPEEENLLDLVFRCRVSVHGAEDSFEVVVHGAIENPIFTSIVISKILFHFGICAGPVMGWIGAKVLKRAYVASKADGGAPRRAALIRAIIKEVGAVKLEVAEALGLCATEALIGGLAG